jgi:hypothetical protein
LFQCSEHCVEDCVSAYGAGAKKGAYIKEPKRKGPTPKDGRLVQPVLFETISKRIDEAQLEGDVVTIHKLAVELQELSEAGKLGESESDGGPDAPLREKAFTYEYVRYWLKRFGMEYGRLNRKWGVGRCREYVLRWLLSYSERRARWAHFNPAESSTSISEAEALTVQCFIDEAFLYRNDSGNYSWHRKGDCQWAKAKGASQRWGIVQCMFTWWEKLPEGEDTPQPGPRPRKRRKKHHEADPANPPGWIRRFAKFECTLECWNCMPTKTEKRNMNTERFLKWLKKVCDFCKKQWPGRVVCMHFDNASYHKTHSEYSKNLDAKKLSAADLMTWIMRFAPPEEGYDSIESFDDEDGVTLPKSELREIAKSFQKDPKNQIEALLSQYGYKSEYTAPLWPSAQPMELYWNNGKGDYRLWNALDKTGDVAKSIRQVDRSFEASDIEGFVRHTDEFCKLVALRSYDTLGKLVIDEMDRHGLMAGAGYKPPGSTRPDNYYHNPTQKDLQGFGPGPLDSPYGPGGPGVPEIQVKAEPS